MLTDLSFLGPGQPWPPESERERLKTYRDNRLLFEAEHAQVFKDTMARVLRSAEELGFQVPTSFEICVNYFRLISVVTAGLLFNRLPGIVAGKEADAEAMNIVQDIDDRSDLQDVLFSCALDVSRYGDGLLYVRKDESGKGIVDLGRPDYWFPVVDGRNIRRTLYHILATPYATTETILGETVKKKYLRAEIHSPGKIETRDYRMRDDNRIGELVAAPKVQQTGLKGFTVFPVANLRPSDRVHGIDDYSDIQSILSEIEVRLAQVSRVLDRHSDPTMQGPEDALTDVYDPKTKEFIGRTFVPGKYFVNQSGTTQGRIEYVTWEAQLDANFKMIDLLLTQLRVISEMGALLSDISDKSGEIPSGAAMRRMLYSAISKINRIRNRFSKTIKAALQAAASLGGDNIDDTPLYIDWPDVLPRDPLEQAQIANIRTSGKATQSRKRAIMELDELDEDDAETELESILEEEQEAMPTADSIFARNQPDDKADHEEPDDTKEGI